MVTLYNKIEELCKSKKINVTQMCKDIGVSRASLSDLKAGRTTHLSAKTIELISNYFGVSADYLLGTDSSEIKKAPTLTKKDERDIARRLEETLDLLESSDALMFDGEPLDEESKELLKVSLQNQYTLAKQIAKQKFTPKKYRNENEK